MLLLSGPIGHPKPPQIFGTLSNLQNMDHVDHFDMFMTTIRLAPGAQHACRDNMHAEVPYWAACMDVAILMQPHRLVPCTKQIKTQVGYSESLFHVVSQHVH
jgi:hypothetical protein